MAWFASLGLVVVLAAGALVPGLAAANAERALRAELPGTDPHVRFEADPLMQLPFGHVPRVLVELDGASVGPFRIPDLDLEATEVHVPPAAVWGVGRPKLLAPAPVRVRAGGTAAALGAELTRFAAGGGLAGLGLARSPLARITGGRVDLADVALTLAPGRIGVTATIDVKDGARVPVSLSFAPVVGEDGRSLRVAEPKASLAGKEIPAMLLRFATSGMSLALEDGEWPGRDWKFGQPEIDETGAWVEARGVLYELPEGQPGRGPAPTP